MSAMLEGIEDGTMKFQARMQLHQEFMTLTSALFQAMTEAHKMLREMIRESSSGR
jgi:hypothetical protein